MPISKSMLLFLFGLGLVSGGAEADSRHTQGLCSQVQAEAADEQVANLNDWMAVDAFFKAYRQCDDGDIAEGSSEAIARLLVDHWGTLPRLQVLIHHEPALQSFVLHHVNATLNTGDLQKIAHYASPSCPEGAAPLCNRIQQLAEQSLK